MGLGSGCFFFWGGGGGGGGGSWFRVHGELLGGSRAWVEDEGCLVQQVAILGCLAGPSSRFLVSLVPLPRPIVAAIACAKDGEKLSEFDYTQQLKKPLCDRRRHEHKRLGQSVHAL